MKKSDIAMWGSHADETGTVTRVMHGGFYARYKSLYPRVDRGGRMREVYESRRFANVDIVECVGFPPAGKVKRIGGAK